jgi:hypothetical protein
MHPTSANFSRSTEVKTKSQKCDFFNPFPILPDPPLASHEPPPKTAIITARLTVAKIMLIASRSFWLV